MFNMRHGDILFEMVAVTNRKLCECPFEEQIKRVCELKPSFIILREKDLTENEYEVLAERILDICADYDVKCILHTYWKTALKLGQTSIHLPLVVLRQLENEERRKFSTIGCSIHSVCEAVEAQRLGASYITAGHIYTTDCKKGVPARGVQFLQEVCESVQIPVYAIGGIHLETSEPGKILHSQEVELTKAGAKGVCIMSGFMKV